MARSGVRNSQRVADQDGAAGGVGDGGRQVRRPIAGQRRRPRARVLTRSCCSTKPDRSPNRCSSKPERRRHFSSLSRPELRRRCGGMDFHRGAPVDVQLYENGRFLGSSQNRANHGAGGASRARHRQRSARVSGTPRCAGSLPARRRAIKADVAKGQSVDQCRSVGQAFVDGASVRRDTDRQHRGTRSARTRSCSATRNLANVAPPSR